MVSIIVALIVCLCSSSVVLGVAAMVANTTVALRREQNRAAVDNMRYAVELEQAKTEKLRALKESLKDVSIEFTTPSKSKSLQSSLPGQLYNSEAFIDRINETINRAFGIPGEQYELNESYKRRLRS